MPDVLLNDFRAQWADVRDDALAAFDRVGRSGWLVLGEDVRRFEAALAGRWPSTHAVGCASGLDALELCLRCVGLEPGDEVLTTPLTAFATTLAIVRAGGVPVFCDTDADGLLDLADADRLLAERPRIRVVMPVHLFGHPLDLDALESLVADRHAVVIEDCAQAVGARFGDRPVGSVGTMSATSFYPTKNLGAMGDGGAVLTNDERQARSARELRDYGQSAKYVHSRVGLNSRLDELQAAMLHDAMLPRLDGFLQRRAEVASAYLARIDHPRLRPIGPQPGATSAWHLFPVVVDGEAEAFRAHLGAEGVGSGRHYPVLCSDQAALDGVPFVVDGDLPNARRLADHEVSLPLHPSLEPAQVERVIDACNGWSGA